MKRLELRLHPVELPLRHAWTIAHGTRTLQRNLIVELHDPATGLSGYGEAAGIPYYGVTVEKMVEHLHRRRDVIDAWDGDVQAGLVEAAHSDPVSCFAACAVDQAMHDLWGKRLAQPVWQLWGLSLAKCPVSNYTIGLAEPEVMVAKLREFPQFAVYKIKLGTGDPKTDLSRIERLRQETDAAFRIDANTAWTAEDTIRLSGPLRDLGVEFIEQPLPADAPRAEHEAVYFGSDLPIMADESCQTEADVERCAGLFHGINIKLTKCGGMTTTRRMIARTRELDLKVMIGCMTETTVGISAIGQLLPLLDYVDMDGALLLAEDVADGVKLGPNGVAVFSETPGNGVTLTRDLAER